MKVCEIFKSIQGEGMFMGAPTVFVRLGECNLRCSWCDTGYSYDEWEERPVEEVLAHVESLGLKGVCITGGEPLLQAETITLAQLLLDRGYFVNIETNGSLSLEDVPCHDNMSISLDIKCPSSGMADKMLFSNIELLSLRDQLKFVVADEKDYDYAKEIIDKHKPLATIIITPVDGKELKWLAEAVVGDGLHVRVLPQLHKLIWGDERGR